VEIPTNIYIIVKVHTSTRKGKTGFAMGMGPGFILSSLLYKREFYSIKDLKMLLHFFCVLILPVFVSAYSVVVPSGASECFVVSAGAVGATCSGSFEVLDSDPTPVAVKLTGPEPLRTVYYETRFSGPGAVDASSSEGNFLFSTEAKGDHTLCFNNGDETSNDGKSRVIAFNFRIYNSLLGGSGGAVMAAENELADLVNGLNFLRDHQLYMNERETIHRDILSKIKWKFVSWSTLEYLLLVLVSLWQVRSILVLFETKRRM
jgi:hypothetical protein